MKKYIFLLVLIFLLAFSSISASAADAALEERVAFLLEEVEFFYHVYGGGPDRLIDVKNKVVCEDDPAFYRAEEQYQDFSAWEARVHEVFVSDLAEKKLAETYLVRNVNGEVYSRDGSGQDDRLWNWMTWEITDVSTKRVLVALTFGTDIQWGGHDIGYYVAESEVCVFELRKEDGLWKVYSESYEPVNPETSDSLLPVAVCFAVLSGLIGISLLRKKRI